jgi:Flp pilus assembly CpaF family ATPase
MRPDRLVIGEVRDGAAFDAVKATNTGHDGTLLTVHAESAEGVPKRLMQLASEAPEAAQLPERTLKEYVASAFQCIVYLERQRLRDGSTQRQVTQIIEVPGFTQNEQVSTVALFARTAKGLAWTRAYPSERTKQRIYAAGFTDQDIEAALNGRLAGWES